MNYLIYTFANWWCYLNYLPDYWWLAVPVQIFLLFNFFTSTWVRYAGVMRFDMIKNDLGPKTKAISYYEAYKFAVEDVLFRFQFAPFMFHELPWPYNKDDWLMTGVLHRIKETNPVDSWKWERADYMCAHMLDKADKDGNHC